MERTTEDLLRQLIQQVSRVAFAIEMVVKARSDYPTWMRCHGCNCTIIEIERNDKIVTCPVCRVTVEIVNG